MNHTINVSDEVVRDAQAGRLPKQALADLLAPEQRGAFLAACAAIESTYTDACASAHDPCLEGGCAAEGEICLEPLWRAKTEYQAACGEEWTKFVRGTERQ